MKLNTKTPSTYTFEGAKAKQISHEQQLRRSVMNCLLWEDEFYEDGKTIATRIKELVSLVAPDKVASIAVEAREKMKLRHVPLLICREMARASKEHRLFVSSTLEKVIQRPDEISEFLSLYWLDGKQPLSAQVKKGLAAAFTKFSEYSLAKYSCSDKKVKLKDVLFLSHAKPKDKDQEVLWKKLINGELATPDTWEVALSSGADKKESWERLLKEKKLGVLATLRNLRNFQLAGVDEYLIKDYLKSVNPEKALPFRFISAAKYGPKFEPELESAMFSCLSKHDKLKGKTIVNIDLSGSMFGSSLSSKSDLNRIDAAIGLAMLIREICEDVEIFTFSNDLVQVPPRRGFALRDAIVNSQQHRNTYLGAALSKLHEMRYDRVITISDEQAQDKIPDPIHGKNYMINVASAKNGVGYGKFVNISGFSESVVNYILLLEQESEDFSI